MKSVGGFLALIFLSGFFWSATAVAGDADDSFAPGGTAIDQSAVQFHDLKIVMDLKANDIESVKYGLTVATRIMNHPQAKLIVIVNGPLVAVFAKKNYLDHQGIIDQWANLAKRGVRIEYCGNSVGSAGLKPSDMGGLDDGNRAIVNPGAFPTLAHYESMGYALVVPIPHSTTANPKP